MKRKRLSSKKYPRMKAMDAGFVEVYRLPKRIPKTVKIGRRSVPVNLEIYKVLWAGKYATKRGRAHAIKKLGG